MYDYDDDYEFELPEIDPDEPIAGFMHHDKEIAWLFLDVDGCTVDIDFVDGTDSVTEEASVDECELIDACAFQLGIDPLEVSIRYY